jgi:hypothetical protein
LYLTERILTSRSALEGERKQVTVMTFLVMMHTGCRTNGY